jgi:hypothetical protein
LRETLTLTPTFNPNPYPNTNPNPPNPNSVGSHGQLKDRWSYINRLRETQQKSVGATKSGPEDVVVEVELRGHLFDSGLINKVLDLLEAKYTSLSMAPLKAEKGTIRVVFNAI